MSHPAAPRTLTTTVTITALAVITVALAAVTVWTSLDVSRSSRRSHADLALGVLYQDIRSAVADEGAALRGYAGTTPNAMRQVTAAQVRLRRAVAELRRRGTRGDRAIAPYIVANELRYQWATRELFAAVRRSDRAEADRIRASDMVHAYGNIQRLVDLAARVHQDRALAATSGVSRRSARFAGIVSVAYVAGILLLAACAYFLLRLQAALRDIAARQHHLARHDALTGVPNRLHWQETIGSRLEDDKAPAAILLIDLDGFKQVNDSLGHHQGDTLLRIVAERLSETVRTDDFVARLGGDEFAVHLRGADAAGAAEAVSKIEAALSEPISVIGPDVVPCASIGIALSPDDGTDIHTLLRRADLAMYGIKSERAGSALDAPTISGLSQRVGSTAKASHVPRDLV